MSARAGVRAVRVALAVVASVVALPAPSAAQAPSVVTLQATPPGFASQQVIALAADVQSTWDIYSWCNYWNGYDGCWVLGPYLGHVEIAGSNGFFQQLSAWESTGHTLSTSDPGPGQTMQAVTYTATGWVAWRVCTAGIFYYGWLAECWAESLYWEPAGTAQKTVVPSIVPTVDSVLPNSGSGATQTFTLKYSSTAGAGDLWQGWVWFTPAIAPTGANSCVLFYSMPTHTLALLNDAGTDWLTRAVGTGPVLQNSQCLVNTLMAGASPSGNTWTVNVPVTFEPAFAGPKHIFMYAYNQWGTGSGWHDKGDWTVQCLTNVTPATPTVPAASGQVTFGIVTGQDCAWTTPATSGFLTRTSGGSGVGSGQVSYAYTANGSANPRTAQPTIAGQVVTVTQIGTTQQPPGEQVSYYHLDAIGSVRVVTNMNGGVVRRHDFLPFGQEYQAPTPTDPVLFTGQERDPETALDYFEARYYTAQTERFTSPDPLTLTSHRLFAPHRLNRYTYAANNPLRFVDPTGLDISCISVPGLGVVCVDDVTVEAMSVQLGNGCAVSPFDLLSAESLESLCPSQPESSIVSLIPVVGSAIDAYNDAVRGCVPGAVFNAALSASDAFLVGGAARAVGRGAFKLGSHSWRATRAWYGETRGLAPGTGRSPLSNSTKRLGAICSGGDQESTIQPASIDAAPWGVRPGVAQRDSWTPAWT